MAPALGAIHGAIEGVDQHRDRPSGVLRLNTSLGAAQLVLRPLILAYLRRYPGMKVELVTDNALIDIVAGGFDAGFRLAETVPVDMTAVTVIPAIRSIVVGSPAYFEGRVPPRSPSDLKNHTGVRARMASGAVYRWEFEKRGQAVEIDVPGDLTLDDAGLIHEAALEGVGLAYVTEYSVRDDLAAGRLLQVLEDWTPSYPGLQLYYPGRRHAPAKLRAFIDMARAYAKTAA
ncbi:LysR substrate-binding domain-containing protein [Brevundimonas sp. GCM10030266]|uniref:LysR substrate-binding domain-containing protein n=1 Tax=Brevundimonas sp. GCM10030266 TaxID=3273386 RepID=UPI003623D979